MNTAVCPARLGQPSPGLTPLGTESAIVDAEAGPCPGSTSPAPARLGGAVPIA